MSFFKANLYINIYIVIIITNLKNCSRLIIPNSKLINIIINIVI